VAGGVEHDGHVHPAGHQPFAQADAQALDHGDGGFGVGRMEALDQIGGDHMGHARRQAHRDAPARVALAFLHVHPGALGQLEDAARMGQQRCAGLGGHGTAPGALQQALAQLVFEQLHLPAQRRLCQVQGGRRAAEAARLGHGHKVLQAGQVHCLHYRFNA
jgi:hypothetical protein